MNESVNGTTGEEDRLCRKCGKRLPSANNFCMYCGCNNNLTDEEMAILSNNNTKMSETQRTELINKSINSKPNGLVNGNINTTNNNVNGLTNQTNNLASIPIREELPLKSKLIYVFVLLDIIFVSIVLLMKSDGLFYEKFKYNLDKYDKVINLDNNSFLVLKDKKVRLLGENYRIDTDVIKEINKKDVLDMGEAYPGSYEILIEVKDKIYSINKYYGSSDEYKAKDTTGNVYVDMNKLNYKISVESDYYSVIDDNYFIKDGALYKYERELFSYSDYYSKLILDKDNLDMKNPVILSTTYQKGVIIKGDNIIKVFFDGKLIQSISKITYKNKVYDISDFKYIWFDGVEFLFVCNNGYTMNYNYSFKLITAAVYYGFDSEEFKEISKNQLNKNVEIDKVSTSSSNTIKSIFKSYKKSLIIFIISIAILIAILCFFRNSNFIVTTFISTGVIFVYVLIYSLYVTSKLSDPKYGETIKTVFESIPVEFIIGIIIAQIKGITTYILEKLNIETIYHFILMLIAVTCLTLTVGVLTGNVFMILVLIGILWAFLSINDEYYVEEDLDDKTFTKLIGFLIGNFILCLIISSIFCISNYYLCIIVISFSISCFMILNEDSSPIDYFKRYFMAILSLLLIYGFLVISSIISTFELKSSLDVQNNDVGKIIKGIFENIIVTKFVEVIFILIVGLIGAIVLFIVNKLLKNVMNKINNRLLKIFVIMIAVIIVVSIIILLLPYVEKLYVTVCNLILGDKYISSSTFSSFS